MSNQPLTSKDLLALPVAQAHALFEELFGTDIQCSLTVEHLTDSTSRFLQCLGLALHAENQTISAEACHARLTNLHCVGFFTPSEPTSPYTCPQCGADPNGSAIHELTHHHFPLRPVDNAINDLINQWHTSSSNLPLHTYLGWSGVAYNTWVETRKTPADQATKSPLSHSVTTAPPSHSICFTEDTYIHDHNNDALLIEEGTTILCHILYCDSRYIDILYQNRSFQHVPKANITLLNCPECA
jgi:hypothetical protein